MTLQPRNVIFDIGNVLLKWDLNALFLDYFKTPEEVKQFIDETDLLYWNLQFDAGMKFADGLDRLCSKFPQYEAPLRAFDEHWLRTVPQTIAGTVAILQRLKAAGVPLFAITNFSAEKWPLAVERYPELGGSFRDVVVSGREGVVKPESEIYLRCLSRNGLNAQDCVFIDDSYRNVEGAAHVGMHALHFIDPEQLEGDLQGLGLLAQEASE